ncbi:glycosyl transferase [Schizopora paradoxa]|uniref:Glycosyl transferase n=1 Tax=Schizopora paradoxa TaxID=27342 RepID=A0A0H2SST1_9AGAM|nr:glycosyl transferase [Schizopora paradoxa]
MPWLFQRGRIVILALAVLVVGIPTFRYWYEIQSTITSASRPLWDTPGGPQNVLPHFDADGIYPDLELCVLHGWKHLPLIDRVERPFWDALILDDPTSAELDMLEIRLHEHFETVDRVFIIESNRTINGTAKGYYFADERYSDRFTWFQHKIVYKAVPAPALTSLFSPSPAEWEARLRSELDDLIRIRAYNTHHKPLVLFSTAEEIPSGRTVRLLKDCDFPAPIHLQLRRYMYSFEWPVAGGWSWRAQVHSWDNEDTGEDEFRVEKRKSGFTLDMISDNVLADAGWHCTNCYRKPEDLITKLRDQLGHKAIASLTPDGVQDVFCEGKDLFNILPEAYSYKDMLLLLKPEPAKSAVGLPRFLIENGAEYRHLLPGGCKRSTVSTGEVVLS